MNTLPDVLGPACDAVAAAIRQRQAGRRSPLVVAVDGGSGAGKSTLAAALRAACDAALIPLDDFFSAHIPAPRWEAFTVEERLRHVFDWERLRRHAVEPLLRGEPAAWHPFDFAAGLRPDGTYGLRARPERRPPAAVILVDGAYSAGPALAGLVDLTVLVDVPVAERHARLAAREDAAFLQAWHRLWDEVEHYYFTQVRPRASFDVVVDFP